MSSISSDLYEEILKPNKSHTNCIVQIIPCRCGIVRKGHAISRDYIVQLKISQNFFVDVTLTSTLETSKSRLSTSSKEREQQQVLTANTKSNEPPTSTPQEKDSKQYKTPSQDDTRREIN